MNRLTFLKFLVAPLFAPLVKLLPKREKPFLPAGVRVEGPSGVMRLVAAEDMRKGDLAAIKKPLIWDEPGSFVVSCKVAGESRVLGIVCEDAPAGGPVLVSLMSP